MKLRIIKLLIALGVILAGCTSTKQFIEGTVVDYHTLRPLPDTEVSVNQIGWGIINRRPVWDKSYTYRAITDNNGNFRIEYEVGSSAKVNVNHKGYVSYEGWYAPNSTITIKLKKKNPNYVLLQHGFLEIGIRDFKPYGWVFSEERITFNRDEADIFPKFDRFFSRENLLLETPGKGGLVFVSKDELDVDSNFLIYSDTAPEEGYVSTLKLDFDGLEGVYFIRTQDNNFAKFSYTTISDYGLKEGNWGLSLEYIYNPDGTRNLEFQR